MRSVSSRGLLPLMVLIFVLPVGFSDDPPSGGDDSAPVEEVKAVTDEPAEPARVTVANLMYGEGDNKSVCFASGYLDLLARETNIDVNREPVEIELGSTSIYKYPFAVMSGEGSFTLSGQEVSRLRDYVSNGGFLLASAGCSNAAWGRSFKQEFARVFPEFELEPLDDDHEVFRTVFDIAYFQTKEPGRDVRLYGLVIDQRLVMIYSPEGLNDTGNAGGGCCCCGGNEIRNAKYVNANILSYALLK